MKRRKDSVLKDDRQTVYRDKIDSLRKELEERLEIEANRIVGKKEWSNSVSFVASLHYFSWP